MNSFHGRRRANISHASISQGWPVMYGSNQSPALDPLQERVILVAEDNQMLNLALCEILQIHGYVVMSASNGSEALEILSQQLPNLVLSDLQMPEMDGYALLKRIRNNPRTRNLPFIFLTGQDTPEDRRRARESGAVDYLIKPVNERELLDAVRVALKRQAEQEAYLRQRIAEVHNQILGLVQHEFRTPLTFIMGYAEFLQDAIHEDLSRDELQDAADAILEGSHRLHHLVESFLLLASLSREALPADEVYPLDPVGLWRECLTEVREALEDAEIKVVLTEPLDPVIVFGVMDLLREALSRLFDNAIRYRRSGERTIWLDTVTKPGYVGWQIRDEGVGISASLLAQLSAPVVRLHQRQADGDGIGLGLALVRRVAELHGGYLEIESEEGVGSTFTLWVSDEERM